MKVVSGDELNRLWTLIARTLIARRNGPALDLASFLTFCKLVDDRVRHQRRHSSVSEHIMHPGNLYARHVEAIAAHQPFGLLHLTEAGDGPGDVPESVTWSGGQQRSKTWQALVALLTTDPRKLRRDGDDRRGSTHSRLQLEAAWRIDNPGKRDAYERIYDGIVRECRQIQAQGQWSEHGNASPKVATVPAAGQLPFAPRKDTAEAILMHGTKPELVLSLVNTGLNPNLSGSGAGTAFGEGVYLAEDAGKTDQYVSEDARYDATSELHKILYGRTHRHPGRNVYYLLVCRVALGYSARTQVHGRDAKSMDTREKLFPVSFRELLNVSGVSPSVFYHSLVAELGRSIDRYREFVVFHREHIYPEFLIAYSRH